MKLKENLEWGCVVSAWAATCCRSDNRSPHACLVLSFFLRPMHAWYSLSSYKPAQIHLGDFGGDWGVYWGTCKAGPNSEHNGGHSRAGRSCRALASSLAPCSVRACAGDYWATRGEAGALFMIVLLRPTRRWLVAGWLTSRRSWLKRHVVPLFARG